jgi:predicted aldo/keto reductase-like oxidoreductase
MSTVTRREFLAGAAALGTATLIRRPLFAAETAAKIKKGTDLVTLGKSGIKSTVLGIGTGTVGGSEQRAMGEANFTKLVHYAFERGIRYIDTAENYSTHGLVRAALKGLPRDQIFIQTKIPSKYRGASQAKETIERYRKELGIEQLDTLLMHAMWVKTWPQDMRPVMDVLQEAKQKGRVRAVGISSHNMPPLEASVDQGDFIDVQLVRINPFGVKAMMDGEPDQVAPLVQKMHKQGRGIIGMKIYGENGYRVKGKDTPESRQKRLQSLKYVLGLGCVDCFTIGFSDPKQIDETLELIEQAQA